MCFANAVLQVLVYCSPFQRLFIDLGKLLPPPSLNGTQLNGHRQTPFIDATVQFLREFIDDGGAAKGKQREIRHANQEEESFLPWYVYDAMKENKRFESMRVRPPTRPTSSRSYFSQGGQQEDAEEFLGFYLDTLEEELLYIQNSLAPPPPPSSSKKQSVVEEKEELDVPEDGWLEVGKKNRTIVTRTASLLHFRLLLEFEEKNRLKLSRVPSRGSLVGGSSRLSELPDSETRYSQKTGDHYGSTFK